MARTYAHNQGYKGQVEELTSMSIPIRDVTST